MHRPIAGGFRRAQSARHEGVSEAVCVVGETGFEPLLDGCPYTLAKTGKDDDVDCSDSAVLWALQHRSLSDGYAWFSGRADEIIKIAGHRIGTIEVETAFLRHPAVAETGVTARPDPVRMEVMLGRRCAMRSLGAKAVARAVLRRVNLASPNAGYGLAIEAKGEAIRSCPCRR